MSISFDSDAEFDSSHRRSRTIDPPDALLHSSEKDTDARVRIDSVLLGTPPPLKTQEDQRYVTPTLESGAHTQTIVRVYPPVIESVTRLHRKRHRVVPQHHQITQPPRFQADRPALRGDLPLSPSFEQFVQEIHFARPLSVHLNFPAQCPADKKSDSTSRFMRVLRRVSTPFRSPFRRGRDADTHRKKLQ